ncbi:MAG: 50S ribosomal protein L17 [Anaerolineae bacterium UTCFX2]|jgi:large subunit ribosomal protein L17|nr:50S ribosomal protein L17 [Anaerolineae bacterium]MCZ7551236.1 50S ribosomal protein L17 [Anaerolineales bacterium]OQY94495.1 MAG: 50S ribosomal protein L17 [Anaerolineae bacterium UTCFX2]
MRHRVAGVKLGRSKDHRIALRKNLVKQLFEHERIQTTRAKAEAVRGQAERLITLAKNGNQAGEAKEVHARRLAAARLGDPVAVKKLFDDIAPRYETRPGGYTRIIKLGQRRGDAAEMVILELVEG